MKRSWFTELKLSGKDLLKDFSKKYQEEVAKQVQRVIQHQGGIIAREVGETVSDFFDSAFVSELRDQVDELTKDLSLESVADFLGATDSKRLALKIAIRMKEPVDEPLEPVQVATGIDLCTQEKAFLRARYAKTDKVLRDEFDIQEPLSIAFCFGAGGVRAAGGALGILTAAARAKILQASHYMAAASGSTWLVTAWASAYLKGLLGKDVEKSLIALRKNWQKVLDNQDMVDTPVGFIPATLNDEAATTFANQMAVRIGYGESVSLVDLYGAMVANTMLDVLDEDPETESERLKLTWSSLAPLAQQGNIPLPLCASIFEVDQPKKSSSVYEWFETSPFQAGSTQLGYIPIQYLGSDFKRGKLDYSTNPAEDVSADFAEALKNAAREASDTKLRPEYPISFFQGVYGSIFGANITDVVNTLLPDPKFSIAGTQVTVPVSEWMKDLMETEIKASTAKKRVAALQAEFMNFSLDVATSALNNKATFALMDPSLAFSFPLPLLLDRQNNKGEAARPVDIIIMYGSAPGDMKSFEEIVAYYKSPKRTDMKNIPDLSKVKSSDLKSKPMIVFNDPRIDSSYDASLPTIIYFQTLSMMEIPVVQSSKVKNVAEDNALADSSQDESSQDEQDVQPVKKRPTQLSKRSKKTENANVRQVSFDVSKMPYKSANFKYTSEELGDLIDAMDYAFTSKLSEVKQIMHDVVMKRRVGYA